jgi:hypothetical protein
LRSPTVVELSLGASVALGARGSVRADLVRRDYESLYASRLDRSTGTSPPDPMGNVYDVQVVGNSDAPTRTYTGVQLQLDSRFGSRLSLGATYTWSRLRGDSIGELGCCAADVARENEYPEYKEARWNHPVGALVDDEGLSSDRRHRARIWLTGETEIGKSRLSASLLESIDSPVGYQAIGRVDSASYVGDLGYARPPFDVAYYFSRPGAYRTEWLTATDLALTWNLPLARGSELFVHAQLFNLFNETGITGVETTVETALSDPEALLPFDPFRETPVEGVHYRLGDGFGRPRGPEDYQQPRTLELAVGLRF